MNGDKRGIDVRVFADSDQASAYLIKGWPRLFRDAVERRGLFTVALSGGRTPRNFYSKLSGISNGLWKCTHIFLADERLVPFNHSDSNFGMLNELLFSIIDIPRKNLHSIPVEASSPEISAKQYETEIRNFFRLRGNELPEFDLILLGIGEDGHTASLFPGDSVLQENADLVRAVFPVKALHKRITLTLPVLNNAVNTIFLVTGDKKSDVLRKVLEERDESLPASLVRPKGSLMFLLDRHAASRLRSVSGTIGSGVIA